jgi:hypothetical protein
MAINKAPLPINFSKGLDLKSDPFQVQPGNFLKLENTIFTKAGLLAKRNGFSSLAPLPDKTYSYTTTFGGNLTAIGSSLSAYSAANQNWVNKGFIRPVSVKTSTLIRNNSNQIQVDTAIAPNGNICTVYNELNNGNTLVKYAIADSTTGQNIIPPTLIPVSSGVVTGCARVFVVGNKFMVVFTNVIAAQNHLQFITIAYNNPTAVSTAADITTSYNNTSTGVSWDAVVVNQSLYVGYNVTASPGTVAITYIGPTLVVAAPTVITPGTGQPGDIISMAVDTTNPTPIICLTRYGEAFSIYGRRLNSYLFDTNLNNVYTVSNFPVPPAKVVNLTTCITQGTPGSSGGLLTVTYEIANAYTFDATLPCNYIVQTTYPMFATGASPSSQVIVCRNVGLASKSFIINNEAYVLAVRSSAYQPTYFLLNVNRSTAAMPVIVSKLAYANAGGYYVLGLPSVNVQGTMAQFPYFRKDSIQAVNKNTNVPAGNQIAGIYSQTGINLASINFTTAGVSTSEIGNNLHLTGGFLSMYDGYSPVEHGFHVWPELSLNADNTYHGITQSLSGGGLAPNTYFYQFTYEWTDNQGNAHRSAPSIPVKVDTSTISPSVVHYGTYASGATAITVDSALNFQAGQLIVGIDLPGSITAGTTITSITGTTLNISAPTTAIGTKARVAVITPRNATNVNGTFIIGVNTIATTTTTGISVGQSVVDQTTPANIPAGTVVTAIDPTTNTITISNNTVAASGTGGDSIYLFTQPVSITAAFTTGTSTMTVNSVAELVIGQTLVDITNSSNLPNGLTTITAINPVTKVITVSQPNNAIVTADKLYPVFLPTLFQSTFTKGMIVLPVSSLAGLAVGQIVTDTDNTGTLQGKSQIVSIDTVNTTITLSLPTINDSAVAPGNTLSVSATLSNIISVPTLRLTSKISNPVKIVGYRWSASQQNYYQFTSIITPVLNSTTVDSIAITDTSNDYVILGNNLIYTTGGVVENIGAPACSLMTLFDTRLFLVDAEDQNLLWFSKQVVEATPVEMSDLFTMYVSPTSGAQGSTGPITALSVLDDKLIIFKKNAIYYMNGEGPDNTGQQNGYSPPVFITSTVGCTNQNSIVFMPNGLMFQSDKGIWLLDRNLNTTYIGAAVETLTTGATVAGALNIPSTNQVRFTLDSGVTLMYDYFYQQWGSFTGVAALSSTLYQNLHTFINALGQVYQESPGQYLDGSNPVLINFTTGWMSLAGLQGYERAYFFYILGNYLSPHTLVIDIAYDFQASPSQQCIIAPNMYAPPSGGDTLYGGSASYGGSSSIEQWRVFFAQQKCQSFQLTIREQYDASLGVPPGAGLTMSGINMIVGLKKGYTTIRASKSVG